MRGRYNTPCTLNPYRWEGPGEPWNGRPPQAGDFLRSSGGSVYELLNVQRIAGDPRRLKLSCLRRDPAEVPAKLIGFHLVWDRRERRR